MSKYKTISIPTKIYEDIQKLVDEEGYGQSVKDFIREACITKIREERGDGKTEKLV